MYVMIMHPLLEGLPGGFLRSFDFEADDGWGDGTFTTDVNEAKLFASHDEAWHYWRTSPSNRPRRDDGEPNCPLMAWSMESAPLSDFTKEVRDG